jgi:hypothetical protein
MERIKAMMLASILSTLLGNPCGIPTFPRLLLRLSNMYSLVQNVEDVTAVCATLLQN